MYPLRGLYLVTPDWDDTEQLLAVSEQALQGGAQLLQYRHKTAGLAQRREQAAALLRLCRRYGIACIINDHLDLCQELDADGVHVGGTDLAPAQVRAALGPDKIVGASCYGDLALAQQAAAAGVSYLAFGGFYPSRVKQYAVGTPADLVSQAQQRWNLPCVVIGGMTVDNCQPLIARGSAMVAVISSVYSVPDPGAAARSFAALF
ncbi:MULTISPECIES: thiamine phosphate synthase [unclassified Undibacterium]|uniref:thiamine phosphate synthase n=2 Tax=Pseudomonadota TaxID=1224 RepID=UPI002AC9BFB9|nr:MULTISPECIES: thiamine phosphate synthase [unclassified Undibacterium]MEB0138254.1 thiamine phosphate synthase [Undibacterium sp. CCC2.1]MEB0171585.1 thiamine phosphate synthase [Undibacterium sp. CCC1.1]MEB0175495.1 thiamine phosphate synthase [Undibacterium sp. CCC3.4]MEB0214785.1 thiamine phosphate synthase [Undibacterium sp. 5I2]WPX45272.1 thiamine phosphate synthase [Undibacterium sp. CCC3.4]